MFTSTQKVVKSAIAVIRAELATPALRNGERAAPERERRFRSRSSLGVAGNIALAAQDRAGRRLIGDQAVDQPAFQRRLDG
jgi:hypothetical protein